MKLKSIISIILACLFIIPLAACGIENVDQGEDVVTLEDFLEKYKRADFQSFLEDPTEFIKDFDRISNIKSENRSDFDYLYGWRQKIGDYYDENDREKDVILFSQSAVISSTYSVYESDNETTYSASFYLSFDTGNISTDFDIAKALTDGMIKLYGDPTEVTIGFDNSTEAQLRKVFSGKPTTFTVNFERDTFHAISFYVSSYSDKSDVSMF